MNHKLLALYGLKWNPFISEVPTEALYVPPKVENFCWRIEQAHLREGGFALIHGDPGSGKSVVMRLLAERLARLADLSVGVIHHPQSSQSFFVCTDAKLTVYSAKTPRLAESTTLATYATSNSVE
jgi:general secretion pathway protein A